MQQIIRNTPFTEYTEELSTSNRQSRSKRLMATFPERKHINDMAFVEGWFFAVHDAFREALDIKYTDVVTDGKQQKAWTQGCLYSFKQGDMLYESRDAYKPINERTKNVACCAIQIIDAVSMTIIEDGLFFDDERGEEITIYRMTRGSITFHLYRDINTIFPGTIPERYTCCQIEFVKLLKTGRCSDSEQNMILINKETEDVLVLKKNNDQQR